MTGIESYTFYTHYSNKDAEWVGRCSEFPSLSWLDTDRDVALAGIRDVIQAVCKDMQEQGETLPAPRRIGERQRDLFDEIIINCADETLRIDQACVHDEGDDDVTATTLTQAQVEALIALLRVGGQQDALDAIERLQKLRPTK